MRWEDTHDGAWAIAGQHRVGRVVALTAPEGHPRHGQWEWMVTYGPANPGRHGTMGYVATKARAKMALVRSWRRWLDERGLVEQESALGMVREALAKARV